MTPVCCLSSHRGQRDQVVPATAEGDCASGLAHFLPGPNAGAVAAQGGGSGTPDPTVVPRPGSSPTQVRAAGGVDEHPAPGAHLGGRGASTAVPGLGLGPKPVPSRSTTGPAAWASWPGWAVISRCAWPPR